MNAYELARKEVGTVEWAEGSNPEVVAYFRDAGAPEIKDDATAWCAAFVGAMLHRAGLKGTGKLTARSYLEWSTPVTLQEAKPGDVVVFKRGKSAWQGHVAFFVGARDGMIEVLGGNQRDAVNVSRYPAKDLLGIRHTPVPKPPASPARPVAPAAVPPVSAPPPAATGLWAAILRLLGVKS